MECVRFGFSMGFLILDNAPYRLVEPWQYDGKWHGDDNDGGNKKKRKRP